MSAGNGLVYLIEKIGSGIKLVARSQSDGQIVWSQDVSRIKLDENDPYGILSISNIMQAPVIASGKVIVAVDQGIVAYDAQTGAQKWLSPMTGIAVPSGIVTIMAAALSSNTLVVTAQKDIHILSLDDGHSTWTGRPESIKYGMVDPVIIGNTLYVVDYGTYIANSQTDLNWGGSIVALSGGGAIIAASEPNAVTVNFAGTGKGTTLSHDGISCSTSCTLSYSADSSVTLTANPDSSSIFSGWSGDCSGTGSCVLAMNVARNVTAQFAVNNPIITRVLTYTSQSLNFGSVKQGAVASQTIVLKNEGVNSLSVSSIVSSIKEFKASTSAFTIPAGGSFNLVMTFSPGKGKAPTLLNGALSISHNGQNVSSPVNIALQGTRIK
jgi:hypothetical protein